MNLNFFLTHPHNSRVPSIGDSCAPDFNEILVFFFLNYFIHIVVVLQLILESFYCSTELELGFFFCFVFFFFVLCVISDDLFPVLDHGTCP